MFISLVISGETIVNNWVMQHFEGLFHLVLESDHQMDGAKNEYKSNLNEKKMKKVFKPMRLFVSMLLLGCSVSFVACSGNEEELPEPKPEVITDIMFGDYAGKMVAYSLVALESEDAPAGVDIEANVNNDTISFDQFPIEDIVLSIVKDETLANKIVKAVGDVSYKVGFKPTLTMAKDSIKLVLDPKPLKLSVTIPSDTEGEEPQTVLVEVKIEVGEEGGYALESGHVKFCFAATEVLLGEGENQNPLIGFHSTTFNFGMNQNRIGYSSL